MKNLPLLALFFLCIFSVNFHSSADEPESTGPPITDSIEPICGDGPSIFTEFTTVTLCGVEVVFNYTDHEISFEVPKGQTARAEVYRAIDGMLMAKNPPPDYDYDGYQGEDAFFEPGDVVTVRIEFYDASKPRDALKKCAKSYLLGR
jgi:hypothetical protein